MRSWRRFYYELLSIVLDNYKRELMDAWYETTLKYGGY